MKHVFEKEGDFRQRERQSCCTAGCSVSEYRSMDPRHAQIWADQALHILRGHEQQQWRHEDDSLVELFHLQEKDIYSIWTN